jgi:hypothetical protein
MDDQVVKTLNIQRGAIHTIFADVCMITERHASHCWRERLGRNIFLFFIKFPEQSTAHQTKHFGYIMHVIYI